MAGFKQKQEMWLILHFNVTVCSVTFAVDLQEDAALDSGTEVRCENYFSVKRVATQCKSNAMDRFIGLNRKNITNGYLMSQLQKHCSEERILYTDCLRENLTHCSNAEDIFKMEDEMNGVCTGDKIAGWITNYALRDFSTIHPDCLRYRPDFPSDIPSPELPNSNTNVEQGIQMLTNMINDFYSYVRQANKNAITCNPWEDTYVVKLLEIFIKPSVNMGMRITDTIKLDIIELRTPIAGL